MKSKYLEKYDEIKKELMKIIIEENKKKGNILYMSKLSKISGYHWFYLEKILNKMRREGLISFKKFGGTRMILPKSKNV